MIVAISVGARGAAPAPARLIRNGSGESVELRHGGRAVTVNLPDVQESRS